LAASAGTLLFKGDVIQTFGETRVTLLFFDAPFSERDNEVIVKENSKVGISSTTSWWGKVWVKVKNSFRSNSTYVRLAASGTEYEFTVDEVGQSATVVVLEGKVTYVEGQFPLTRAGLLDISPAHVSESPFALLRNFAHAVSPQVQPLTVKSTSPAWPQRPRLTRARSRLARRRLSSRAAVFGVSTPFSNM